MTEMIIVSVVCVALGVLVGVLFTRGQKQSLMAQLQVLNSQVEDAKNAAETAKAESANRIREIKENAEKHLQDVLAEKDKAAKEMLDAQEKSHSEAFKAQKGMFEETMAKVSEQMKTATDQMLKQRQKEFTDASNTNLGQIVNPLKDTIEKLKKSMEESSEKQSSLSGEMKASIANMLRQSEAAKQSAEELTRVFKHGSKVQGDWGETVLDELLQSQGLTQGVQYDVQTYIRDAQGNIIKSDDGAMMRPDIILHLDQRREVVIDSKVSLTAFMDYVNADTDEKRDQALKTHIDSIVKHVKELSTKDYSSYIQPPKVKMDYVIMFVPNTGALWTALNSQPDLWRKAMEKNVYIADEQTLYAALRIIKLTWTQIEQAQNHQKVYALADEIMDRVGQFIKHYQIIGRAIDNAKKAFDEGDKKLQPQGQSILQSCGKMQKLGAKQSAKNPLPQLVDIDDIPALGAEYVEDEPNIG